MYYDSCLLELSQGLILLQSIAKCCCSLVSDLVVTQADKSQIMQAMYFDSCLLETSQGLILLQSIAKSHHYGVPNDAITNPETKKSILGYALYSR